MAIAADPHAPEEKITSIGGVIAFYLKHFGATTFGVVTLVVIWQVIVQPQMDAQKLNFERLETIMDKQRETGVQQIEVARTLERTAQTMQTSLTQLEDIAEALAKK